MKYSSLVARIKEYTQIIIENNLLYVNQLRVSIRESEVLYIQGQINKSERRKV